MGDDREVRDVEQEFDVDGKYTITCNILTLRFNRHYSAGKAND